MASRTLVEQLARLAALDTDDPDSPEFGPCSDDAVVVSGVYRDGRARVLRSGPAGSFCFNVHSEGVTVVHRADTLDDAREARDELIEAL